MSTTPFTFDKELSTYTVVGQTTPASTSTSMGSKTSLLVLGRVQKIFQMEALLQLAQADLLEVLVLESSESRLYVETLARDCPRMRFLLFHQSVTPGEMINRGMEEARGERVLVVWDDLSLPDPPHLVRALKLAWEKIALCQIPELRTQKGEEIPTLVTPGFLKKSLKTKLFAYSSDDGRSLFPFDYVGLYHREKFLASGGFDHRIESTHWQKMDWGLRIHLWGEEIVATKGLRLDYQGEIPVENGTPDQSYRLFFLKNLLILFQKDMGVLPPRRFWSFFFQSRLSWFQAHHLFKMVSHWVQANRYRFKKDARGVVELWENPI